MARASILFTAAKTKMREKSAINQNDIARLLDAPNYNNAIQTLLDIGFLNSAEEDYEVAADRYISQACQFVREYTPQNNFSNALLYNYDGHNLKILFKARLLNVEPDFLYNCGTINVSKLKHAIINRKYDILPKTLKLCMNQLEKLSVTGLEPYVVDAEIDKAIYELIFENISVLKNNFIIDYFKNKVDMINAIILLRVSKMGKSINTLEKLLINNGNLNKEYLYKNFNNPAKLYSQLLKVDNGFAKVFMQYLNEQVNISDLEKIADNILMLKFKPYEYNPLNIEYIMAYIIKVQRQAAAIRLILAAKASGVSNDIIRERMRLINAK